VRIPILLAACGLIVGLGSTARAETVVDARVPFAFTAGTTNLPAGHYRIDATAGEDFVVIQNVDTRQKVAVEFETRLAPRPDGHPTLVFDDVGGKHVLSEIHRSTIDGYELPAAGRKVHTHRQVDAG
jgi:hypothetical protein